MEHSVQEKSQTATFASAMGLRDEEFPGPFDIDRPGNFKATERESQDAAATSKKSSRDNNDSSYMNFYDGEGRCINRKRIDGGDDNGEEHQAAEEEVPPPPADHQQGSAQPQSNDNFGSFKSTTSPSLLNIDATDSPSSDSLELIDELLEEQYRGQAETFTCVSSRASSIRAASVRSAVSSTRSPSLVSSTRNISPLVRSPSLFTPTRVPSHSFASIQRTQARTPSSATKSVLQSFRLKSGGSGFSPTPKSPSSPEAAPYSTYGHRIRAVPDFAGPRIAKRASSVKLEARSFLYFTAQERERIDTLVHAEPRNCERHTNCTDCTNTEYAYFENKAMPTSMPPEERQTVINNNRSLRNIKNVSIVMTSLQRRQKTDGEIGTRESCCRWRHLRRYLRSDHAISSLRNYPKLCVAQ